MIERNTQRNTEQRNLQRARRRGIAPSSSLRRHFFALARQVKQWSSTKVPGLTQGFTIGVTSLERGIGKSTISFNLACSLGSLTRSKSLLVESDFGKHFITRRIGMSRSPGLSEILIGVADPSEVIAETPLTNLSVMGCGRKTDQEALELPFDLLPNVISESFNEFGFVVFDLPVASHLTACHSMVPHLDGVILAVESNQIDHRQVDRFRKQLEGHGVDVIGVVLNKA